jgi:C-terminal processing protease CtpA/Prc
VRVRAVIDSMAGVHEIRRLVVDLRSSLRKRYREGTPATWLGAWTRQPLLMGQPLSVLRESAAGDLSAVKWIVSPRMTLTPRGTVISVPTVFLVNRTSYAAGELVLDALRSARNDVAVVFESTGPIPNLGYNSWQTWYPDSILLPHFRTPVLSSDGALGSVVDATSPRILAIEELDSIASQAMTARAAARPRTPFVFADSRILDDTASRAPLSREQRVAGLLKVWYWVSHFYAYLDDATGDWRHLLSTWVPRVEAASDNRAYLRVIEQVGALLNDSHTSVRHPDVAFDGRWGPGPGRIIWTVPLYLMWVGDRVAIARVDTTDAALGIAAGDELLSIDGVSVRDLERRMRAYASISEPGARLPVDFLPHSLVQGGPAMLHIRTVAGIKRITLLRSRGTRSIYGQTVRKYPLFAILPGNIGYLNMGLMTSEAIGDSALCALAGTRGLILDDRSAVASEADLDLFRFLTATTPWIPWVDVVEYLHNDYTPMRAFGASQTWDVPAIAGPVPKYTKPVVMMTSRDEVSHGESIAIWLRSHHRAVFVGEPSNGTYGVQGGITIPGGASFTFSIDRALLPNGSKYHGIGVAPDVPAAPTFAGLRAGRDEVYDKAITTLRSLVARDR